MSAARSFTAGFVGATLAAGLLVAGGVQPTAITPTTAGAVTFTASGDFNSTTQTSAVLNQIKTIGPDLHLALGDLAYTSDPEQVWCDYVTARTGAGFPFELVAGNHESNGLNGNIDNFSACLPNQLPGAVGTYGRQYYVDVPQRDPLVRFIQVSAGLTYPDGLWSYSAGTARYLWTAAAIDSARAAGIPWVVVSTHKPCLSVGQYSCDTADLTNLLVSKRVDLVLSGHEHLYSRTKQLAQRAGCAAIVPGTFTAACVVDADDDLARGAGTVFATVGTGGTPLRNVTASDSEAQYFAASSGLNSSPSWGSLLVTADATSLSAGFQPTAGGTYTDAFVIRQGTSTPNEPPVASFTTACTDLTCTADASASSDSDGTIASSAWNFGDGTPGTGTIATHSYAVSGTYTVALTVTDDDGAVGTVTHPVTVSVPGGPTVYASDAFSRTVTTGFGTADTGGAWSTTGTSTAFQVAAGVGFIRHAKAGGTLDANLPSPASTTTDLQYRISADKPPTGGGIYIVTTGRRVPGAGSYKAQAIIKSTGQVTLALSRENPVGAGATIQAAVLVPGLSYSAGDQLLVRMQVTGTSPTTVQARIWKSGTPEPAVWHRSITDATGPLQAAGSTGVSTYVSSSATNAPVVLSLDDYLMRAP
ncbi:MULTISPECIES: PKD domain-containing protein [unclassified Leifsonia]|uniref:PKD domain-containing protein n=1 Tax=unclassified Leifsonia TaxID=2663824 RepID=UPI00070190B9|nr:MULTISPECIES: PKD domain-containing protein [unclassified Leifsonia]KQX06768.1 hypothetical protein ASC59_02760 [Leifsonia sp. Root1293]KRA11053.1 hypothetical protein ASD61_02760 [Leifsonia sp. Root60]